uniref:Uncharacterized protein n=1 Tax=Trichuris muris TaxID=70415 RepID=A0A5S6QCS7_TRIMR
MYRLSGVNRRLRVDAFYGRRQGERLYFRKEHCTYRSSYSRRPHCGTVHGVGQERYDSSNHADYQRYNYSSACSNPPYAQYNYSQGPISSAKSSNTKRTPSAPTKELKTLISSDIIREVSPYIAAGFHTSISRSNVGKKSSLTSHRHGFLAINRTFNFHSANHGPTCG